MVQYPNTRFSPSSSAHLYICIRQPVRKGRAAAKGPALQKQPSPQWQSDTLYRDAKGNEPDLAAMWRLKRISCQEICETCFKAHESRATLQQCMHSWRFELGLAGSGQLAVQDWLPALDHHCSVLADCSLCLPTQQYLSSMGRRWNQSQQDTMPHIH